MNNNIKLLSIPKAAELMGIGANTLRKIISDGKIAVVSLRKQKKVTPEEIDRFIRDNTGVMKANTIPETTFSKDILSFQKLSPTEIKKSVRFDSSAHFEKLLKEAN